jgi:ribose transport system ATP-binding protein
MSCLYNINLGVLAHDASLGWVVDREKARARAKDAFSRLQNVSTT